MVTQAILQTIGMEAAVLAFLFGMAYLGIRVCLAERQARADQHESVLSTSDQPFA